MAACTFFGHHDYQGDNEDISVVLHDLICNKGVDTFYVGNQGNFDSSVLWVLRLLKGEYVNFRYFVVLAYHPAINRYSEFISSEETLLPEEIANVPARFGISKRNEWMIKNSEYAVVFVRNSVGGAAKYKLPAEKRGLEVINLYCG